MIKLPKAAVWAIAILVAVVFVYTGISKLGGPSARGWGARLARWGYPAYARYVIGVFEIIGGLGVLIPRSRRIAAAILVTTMIGALITHAVHAELPRLIPPVVLGSLALVLYLTPSLQRRTDARSRTRSERMRANRFR